MKPLPCLVLTALLLAPLSLSAGEDWAAALTRMPLRLASRDFNRTNCIECMLGSLQPNDAVKGIAFLPGATDELYLTRRVQPQLSAASATLLDAVHSLTNGTSIRATFRSPLLLLHTAGDLLEPVMVIAPEASLPDASLGTSASPVVLVDRDWERVQPWLRKALGVDVLPRERSRDSWHFYRLNLAGIGLNAREAIAAVCLTSKTCATVEQHWGLLGKRPRLVFSPDKRLAAP